MTKKQHLPFSKMVSAVLETADENEGLNQKDILKLIVDKYAIQNSKTVSFKNNIFNPFLES